MMWENFLRECRESPVAAALIITWFIIAAAVAVFVGIMFVDAAPVIIFGIIAVLAAIYGWTTGELT